jgi:hypothetical protein
LRDEKDKRLAQVRQEAAIYEARWLDVVEARGETRYVEMLDRKRRAYGRLTLPSEVLYVWWRDCWKAANEGDLYQDWEPVTSQVVAHGA